MKSLLAKLDISYIPSFRVFIKQFLKFGIVGVTNTLIALAVYYSLIFFGIHYIIANFIAFIISVCNAYFWNSRVVFLKKKGSNAKPLARAFAAYGITFLLGTGFLFLMIDILRISQWVAPLINLCFTVPANFLLNKYWVFKKSDTEIVT